MIGLADGPDGPRRPESERFDRGNPRPVDPMIPVHKIIELPVVRLHQLQKVDHVADMR